MHLYRKEGRKEGMNKSKKQLMVATSNPSPPPLPFSPFHLVEITLVSAQDLFEASSSMRTYAVASIGGHLDGNNRFRTSIDPLGHANPKWNDKHIFRVDDATLRSDTSALTVDIYAVRSGFLPVGGDTLLGTARALLGALQLAMSQRFVALQVRRPSSLRPQGILNLGAAVVDPHAKGAPPPPLPRKEARVVAVERPMVPKVPNVVPVPVGPGAVKMVRSKSMKLLEKKLEMWRVELPLPEAVAEETMMKKEKEKERERREAAAKAISRRTAGRMSCFCIEPESEEGGHGGGRVAHS